VVVRVLVGVVGVVVFVVVGGWVCGGFTGTI
jgi:hypothetical protein